MTPRICVSVLPKDMSEALSLLEKAEDAKATLVEVRLDRMEESRNLKDLAKSTKLPLIATNKLQSERGFFTGNESERQQTLINAAKSDFEFVDVDSTSAKHQETISALKQLGVKTIASFHKFDGPLNVSAMEKILNEQIASGANICKIITTANKADDNLHALNFTSEASGKTKLVCFCMGEEGKISRLLSPLFGADFTFAALEKGVETAAGQMSIQELRAAYELLGVTL